MHATQSISPISICQQSIARPSRRGLRLRLWCPPVPPRAPQSPERSGPADTGHSENDPGPKLSAGSRRVSACSRRRPLSAIIRGCVFASAGTVALRAPSGIRPSSRVDGRGKRAGAYGLPGLPECGFCWRMGSEAERPRRRWWRGDGGSESPSPSDDPLSVEPSLSATATASATAKSCPCPPSL
ncbi:hypothetical protein T492DRAFT_509399 [Pavlovales sp. CCMP2436]|nr:hypothetical protein T492DRAFT_509399 [Pavlovales sp. CCMP2436]